MTAAAAKNPRIATKQFLNLLFVLSVLLYSFQEKPKFNYY